MLPAEPSSSVEKYQMIQLHDAGWSRLNNESMDKISSPWRPHHPRVSFGDVSNFLCICEVFFIYRYCIRPMYTYCEGVCVVLALAWAESPISYLVRSQFVVDSKYWNKDNCLCNSLFWGTALVNKFRQCRSLLPVSLLTWHDPPWRFWFRRIC